jgi:hypothetical protein
VVVTPIVTPRGAESVRESLLFVSTTTAASGLWVGAEVILRMYQLRVLVVLRRMADKPHALLAQSGTAIGRGEACHPTDGKRPRGWIYNGGECVVHLNLDVPRNV